MIATVAEEGLASACVDAVEASGIPVVAAAAAVARAVDARLPARVRRVRDHAPCARYVTTCTDRGLEPTLRRPLAPSTAAPR